VKWAAPQTKESH